MENISNIKTIAELNAYKKSINEEIETKRAQLKREEKASEMANKGFGYIKEAFENISPILYTKTKGGKKIMLEYVETIKSNKNLSKLHSIYESLRKATSNTDVDFFVNALVSANHIDNKTSLKEDIHKLGLILGEAYLMIDESVDSLLPLEKAKLDKAIEFITENKKSLNTLAEFSKATYVIKEEISNHPESIEVENTSSETLINQFNENYEDLDEETIEALKTENSEESFNELKETCEKSLDDEIENTDNDEEKERFGAIKETINKKVYHKETFLEDAINLHKILNVLK